MLTITNEDCMVMMGRYPDKHFDLAIARKLGLQGCELDEEYYKKGIERVKNHVSQQRLFDI